MSNDDWKVYRSGPVLSWGAQVGDFFVWGVAVVEPRPATGDSALRYVYTSALQTR